MTTEQPPNNSFKPNLLRYGKGMAEKACHTFAFTTQVGLTQALAVMSTFPHRVYTVMAGCGVGEFLWVKDSGENCIVGGNVFSQMDCASDQALISEGLFNKLFDWAGQYMHGQPLEWGMPWEIDWVSFNTRGIELAQMLHAELGASSAVQYVRANEDPSDDQVLLSLPRNDG